jgi:hypothetical protein
MNYAAMLKLVYRVACDCAKRGPGWSQQSTVLFAVAEETRALNDQQHQQLILTCWHDLFALGLLSWGFNIDNPDSPFFHVPPLDQARRNLAEFPCIDPSKLVTREAV